MKIHLTAGDGIGWAIDEDRDHVIAALDVIAGITSLRQADAVLAFWWAPLMTYDAAALDGKRVACLMHGDPARFLQMPEHRLAFERVSLWGVRSHRVLNRLQALGYPAAYIPYKANTEFFTPLPPNDPELQRLRAQISAAPGTYLIASIARDSEGADMGRPKLVKGPDMFAELMRCALDRGLPVHAVLTGPRRHWLRRRLDELGVPYSFLGQVVAGDDMDTNILSRSRLNAIYNLADLAVVTSRSEGAPMAALEAPVAGCKLISTPVGMADETLPPEAIFRTPEEGADLIAADIRSDLLSSALATTQQTLSRANGPAALRAALQDLLARLSATPPCRAGGSYWMPAAASRFRRRVQGLSRRLGMRPRRPRVESLGSFAACGIAPPEQLLGERVRSADSTGKADVLIVDPVVTNLTSLWERKGRPRVIALAGIAVGTQAASRLAENLRRLDAAVAVDATVFGDEATLEALAGAGCHPMRPVLIPPTPDPAIFHSRPMAEGVQDRKRRLLSVVDASGAADIDFYGRLRNMLDWTAVDFTVLGAPLPFSEFIRAAAGTATERAALIRDSDLLVEPGCGAAAATSIAEALACGVPVVFRDCYANREQVRFAGRPFAGPDEAAMRISEALARYESLCRLLETQETSDPTDAWGRLVDAVATRAGNMAA